MTTSNFKTTALRGSLALLVVGLAILTVVLSRADSTTAKPSTIAAPEWELKDVDGKSVKLSDFKGKVVVLDFWATWCAPCRMEIPGFIELQKEYGANGLAIIGVSLDEPGPSVVKPFMKQLGINYPVVMGDAKVVRDYGGIEGIPTTFIIDRQGRIVGKHMGFAEKQVFEKEIKRLLKK